MGIHFTVLTFRTHHVDRVRGRRVDRSTYERVNLIVCMAVLTCYPFDCQPCRSTTSRIVLIRIINKKRYDT